MFKSLAIGAGAALLFAVPAFACTDISSATIKFTGCVDEQWVAQAGAQALEFSYLTADSNFALQVVTETDVIPAQTMRGAILQNAANAVDGKAENVTIVSEHIENIDGKPFNEIEYTLTDGTNTLTYQNYYYSQPGLGTVQILALSAPADVSAAAFKLGVFAGTVKIGG